MTWETNSSSSHTLVYSMECINDLVVVDGTITIGTDEYGWVGDPCVTASEKLEYAAVMLLMTEYPNFEYWKENVKVKQEVLENLEGYKLLLEAINKEVKCNKIVIEREMIIVAFHMVTLTTRVAIMNLLLHFFIATILTHIIFYLESAKY